ncbi:hypothetical protein ATANTOWER_027451 [Ataeniobius toweri]|uniref:Uncharacterized protein n=1 Tax=Ataeniobius toweri TaxID=208326 RepID=A0ABU7A344_9TELE|nr:hypothetical protein [Ataeniobius toweri]
MPRRPKAINPLPQGHTPTDKLHPRKAYEATSTQRKPHTQPCSKHPCRTLSPTTQRAAVARQGPCATPPETLPTGATEQTPASTILTTDTRPHLISLMTYKYFKI